MPVSWVRQFSVQQCRSTFTPPVVAALAGNLPAIVAATIAVFLIGALGALMLSHVSGDERKIDLLRFNSGGRHGHGGVGRALWRSDRARGGRSQPAGFAGCYPDPVCTHLWRNPLGSVCLPTRSSARFAILSPWLSLSFFLGEVSERMRFYNGCLLMPIFFGAALTLSGMELSAVPHR